MKTRLISLLLIAVFLLSFAACGNKPISAQKAQEIAFEDAGISADDALDVHNHLTQAEDGTTCYNIHFTANGTPYNYMISAEGEVISVTNEAGH